MEYTRNSNDGRPVQERIGDSGDHFCPVIVLGDLDAVCTSYPHCQHWSWRGDTCGDLPLPAR